MVVKSLARHRVQKPICRRLVFLSLNKHHQCASRTARRTQPWFPPTKAILQLCSTQSRHLLPPTTLLCLPDTNTLTTQNATAPSPTLLCSAATQRLQAQVALAIHLPTNFLHKGEYKIGSIAMANSGPNTNGSQFFIITGENGATLNPDYTLFGQVIEGLDQTVPALNAASNPDPAANGVPPTEDLIIISVAIIVS